VTPTSEVPNPSLSPAPQLAYDTPLAIGQIRVHRPSEGRLVISVGPPPLARQMAGVAPVAVLFGFLCVCFGLLAVGILFRPEAIPYDKLLMIPVLLVLGFSGVELAVSLRGWSAPCQLTIDQTTLGVPYPTERSPIEQVPAHAVDCIKVVSVRTRLLRRHVDALEIRLSFGPTFRLFAGYPRKTLDELTDLLGPPLGLTLA